MSEMVLPPVTLPAQAAIRFSCGGVLNSAVVQNRQTGVGQYVEVWFQDSQPDPTDHSSQFYFQIQPGTALCIDPSDTANEEQTRKIFCRSFWLRGNAVPLAGPATVDVFATSKYGANQQQWGSNHLVQV